MSEIFASFLEQMLLAYLQLVMKKHGVTPISEDQVASLSHDEKVQVLASLTDLAKLPPK